MSAGRRRTMRRSADIVAFSISYDKELLLARGLGLEHLKELVIRFARPIVARGLGVAYAGSWRESESNFTRVLLRLISAEQDDTSDDESESPDACRTIEPLINHQAWPHYLGVTPRLEAEWINSCRILRVHQQHANLGDLCPDSEATSGSERAIFNAAATLSVMRRLQVEGMRIPIIPGGREDCIPPVSARIVLGGKTTDFSGFLPGVFEEALLTLESCRPLYILGGFGGAAADLAQLILEGAKPESLKLDWIEAQTPNLARLRKLASQRTLPLGVRDTHALLNDLDKQVARARTEGLAKTLGTGLDDERTSELMTTVDIDTAVRLLKQGLATQPWWPPEIG